MTDTPYFVIDDLTIGYHKVPVIRDISVKVQKGEIIALIGPNGAGKTTLFRILTGEIDYDAGEVAIASDRRVGLISQIPVYPAGYTVEDVLQSAFELSLIHI